MDDASAAELRRLRARAYGPDADLLEDPAASSRLMELEAQLRAEREAERPPVATASSASGTGREPGPAAEAQSPDAPAADLDAEAADDPATRRLWALVRMLTSRLPPVATAIVAVSIAAAIALTASKAR